MAYSDFDLTKVRKDFGLQIDEQSDLFADIPPVQPSVTLANTLIETAHLAIAINTEKARSAMLITPVLLDIWRQAQSQISLFSGTEFNVDEARGLTGYCDYILSRSKEQLTTHGSPIFRAVQKKWCTALYRALMKNPTTPESAVGAGSEPSYVERAVGVP